jgi:proteasome lid subunit RPN8/RPN11
MALRLSRKHHAQLLEWAEAAGKQECCGLLLGNAEGVTELVLTNNVAADSAQHFEIDPADLIAAHKRTRQGGLTVLGCFHSHPNGLAGPSATDVRQAAGDGQIWLIVANGQITAWETKHSVTQMTEFEPVALIVEG